MTSEPNIFGRAKGAVFGSATGIAPAGSADAVLTFRNVHNFMAQDTVDQAFRSLFDALKPGGR
jgi:predicted methyltransferase